MTQPIGILGAGLSGLCFAYYSKLPCVIFEKEDQPGGLCRSFRSASGVPVDLGPHIFFSKNHAALEELLKFTPMHQLRRSNKIWYDGRRVRYPFENDLYSLPDEDKEKCLRGFLDKRPLGRPPENMLEFFQDTFGEGMTECYFEPINRKIWKCELSELDTQMVSRIPNPPREHIIRSARGESIEGFTHQLHFWYPYIGGTQSVIEGIIQDSPNIQEIKYSEPVIDVTVDRGVVFVSTDRDTHAFESIVSTIPLQALCYLLAFASPQLEYNSLHLTTVTASRDKFGDDFSLFVPDKHIPFHRVSKIDFLGENYSNGFSTIVAEATLRDTQDVPTDSVINSLDTMGLVRKQNVRCVESRIVKYAYPVYTLEHREEVDRALASLPENIIPLGRFGTWEYLNMDQVLLQASEAAKKVDSQC
jgi:protoporphyrinogen oxidase